MSRALILVDLQYDFCPGGALAVLFLLAVLVFASIVFALLVAGGLAVWVWLWWRSRSLPRGRRTIEGEYRDVDFGHDGPQQSGRLERAQPFVAEGVGERVDLEKRFTQGIVAGSSPRAK